MVCDVSVSFILLFVWYDMLFYSGFYSSVSVFTFYIVCLCDD